MKKLQLTQEKFTLVDDSDYWFLMDYNWSAIRNGNTFYSKRTMRLRGVRIVIYMHRLIMSRILGHSNFKQVDHIDGNGLNNTRENLRVATNKQNHENMRLNTHNSSGVSGVHWSRRDGRWVARICHNSKRIFLGCFDNLRDAEIAVIVARNRYYTHNNGK